MVFYYSRLNSNFFKIQIPVTNIHQHLWCSIGSILCYIITLFLYFQWKNFTFYYFQIKNLFSDIFIWIQFNFNLCLPGNLFLNLTFLLVYFLFFRDSRLGTFRLFTYAWQAVMYYNFCGKTFSRKFRHFPSNFGRSREHWNWIIFNLIQFQIDHRSSTLYTS